MIALQSISAVAWLALMAYFTPALFRVLFGQQKSLDTVWSVLWFLALNRFCFNFSALIVPGHEMIRVINFTCSIIGAALLFGVSRHER